MMEDHAVEGVLATQHRVLGRIVRSMELIHDGDPLLTAVLRHDEQRTEGNAYELLGGVGRVWRDAVSSGRAGSSSAYSSTCCPR